MRTPELKLSSSEDYIDPEEIRMSPSTPLGGTFHLPGTDLTLHRMGYGAMQLAGPHVFGPPRDRDACVAVLRAAIEAGVDHIDTAEFYGPHVTNQILREALHPYPAQLTLVTKVGARRDDSGAWLPAQSAAEVVEAVEQNLRTLGVDVLDVVNFRAWGRERPTGESLAEGYTALAELQQQGKIRYLGVSHVTESQVEEALGIAPLVCVQNLYNLALREDDALLDSLGQKGIAFVPYFPLGGFTPLQSGVLDQIARELEATPMQVALAWLLHRAPHVLLIPGTSSVAHLRENLSAAELELAPEILGRLDAIGAVAPQ
jgi:pyridoxine 4-dehydrogenase